MAFPAIESINPTADSATGGAATSGSTAATSHAVVMPATVSAGSLLMVFGRVAAAGTVSATGWTVVEDSSDAADDTTFYAYMNTLAAGTEDGSSVTFSHANGKMVATSISVTGAADPASRTPEASTVAVGTTTTVDPTTVTPTGGAKDYLWIWFGAWDGEQTLSKTAATNYTDRADVSSGTGGLPATNVQLKIGDRTNNAASENPGTVTLSGAPTGWTAWTIAIHPPGALTLSPSGQAHTRAQGSLEVATGASESVGLIFRRSHSARRQQARANRVYRVRTYGRSRHVRTLTTLSPASLSHTRAQGTPTVSPSIVPAGQAHTRALGSPKVGPTLGPSGLAHSRAQGTPTVSPTVSPAGQSRTRALGDPSVSVSGAPVGVAASFQFQRSHRGITYRRRAYRPQAFIRRAPPPIPPQTASPASLTHTRALGSPIVGGAILPTGIAHTRVQGSPYLNPTVLPGSQVHTRALGDPVVTLVIPPVGVEASNRIIRSQARGYLALRRRRREQPRITVGITVLVPDEITPSALVHTRALGSPTVAQAAVRQLGNLTVTVAWVPRPASLVRTRAQGSLNVLGRKIDLTGLSHTRAQGNPQLSARVLPAGQAHTRAQGSPSVNPKTLSPTALSHTRAQGSPVTTVLKIFRPPSLTHTRTQGSISVTGRMEVGPPSLVRVRAQGTPILSGRALPVGIVHLRVLGNTSVNVRTLVPAGISRA